MRETALATATDDPQTRATFVDAVTACHDRLEADGVDVAAYHLSAMAADAEDLRAALSIDEWNVVTYGTAARIAFEMMRQHPDHVRSVLLDSPEVPGTDPRAIAVEATRASLSAVLADLRGGARTCASSLSRTRHPAGPRTGRARRPTGDTVHGRPPGRGRRRCCSTTPPAPEAAARHGVRRREQRVVHASGGRPCCP